jgi:hypothetical protein
MTRLLMVTNEVRDGTELGLRDEFAHLLDVGVLEAYGAVAPVALARGGVSWPDVVSRLAEVAARLEPTLLLVLSPKAGQWTGADVAQVLRAAPSASLAYWEGDPWGRRHRPTSSMLPWLQAADQVFSVALGEQYDVLRAAGAKRIRFVPHTYCHVQFADAEQTWEPPRSQDASKVVMVASRAGRLPGISTVPGARQRWRLVRLAARRFGHDFGVYGRGWSGPSAAGMVPFDRQTVTIRAAAVSVSWDHYPHHAAYASDRLPISLVAGRPHVTTRHPDMEWLPGEDAGLFLVDSPAEAVEVAAHVRELPLDASAGLGRAAHAWVKDRMSDRQAGRYLLRESGGPSLDLPDPWDRFVTMGDGRS